MFPSGALVVFAISSIVQFTHTTPVPRSDYSSAEDSDLARSDDSDSPLHQASGSVVESDIKSAELSAEVNKIDDISDVDLSLAEEQPNGKKGSVLEAVFDNAGRFSEKLEKAVGVADSKVTDWSKRIRRVRNHIFGPRNFLNGGGGGPGPGAGLGDPFGNGGGQFGNGGGNYFPNGGGGQWNQNGLPQQGGYGGGSIMSAYYTIWPFFKEMRVLLTKMFRLSSEIVSSIFMPIVAPSRQSRPYSARPWSKGRRSPRYQYRGRGRGRFGVKKNSRTPTIARETYNTYAAYDAAESPDY